MPDDTNISYQPPDKITIERGYEADDPRTWPAMLILIGFLVCSAAIVGGLWLYHAYEVRHAVAGEPRSAVYPSASLNADAPPLQPQLGHDSLDAWDLQKMRQQEDDAFRQLGWPRDERHHRFAVPTAIIDALRQKQAATQPGRP